MPLHCPLPSQMLWNSHPRVFLPIEKAGEALCPYCGTRYILKGRRMKDDGQRMKDEVKSARGARLSFRLPPSAFILARRMTRILIVAPSWVGDALLSQPLLTPPQATAPPVAHRHARARLGAADLPPHAGSQRGPRKPVWPRRAGARQALAHRSQPARQPLRSCVSCCRTPSSRRWYRCSPAFPNASVSSAKCVTGCSLTRAVSTSGRCH